jgi:hypothetical protein
MAVKFIIIFISVAILIFTGWSIFLYLFTRGLVRDFFKGDAPFIPSKPELLPEIVSALGLSENSTLYDLGCGDARILTAGCRKQPQARYVGYEKNMLPYLWAKMRVRKMRLSENIRICRKDFFAADLSGATHVFTYLLKKQMIRLEPKLQKELKAGTILASLSFPLQSKKPEKIVSIWGKAGQKEKKLYVYVF